jgi:Domain of unknown function (DUF4157)
MADWQPDSLLGALGLGSVQRAEASGGATTSTSQIHEAAQRGVSGAGQQLPHLTEIQQSFGSHDVSGVRAHVGGAAADASNKMGANAYATGDSVAFGSSPDLHLAAHEAAHVVQQRGGVQLKGGVGQVGDPYERHADAVADLVVQGKSAESLLTQMAPAGSGAASSSVQRQLQFDIKADLRAALASHDVATINYRLTAATPPEARAVLADSGLMNELGDTETSGDVPSAREVLQTILLAHDALETTITTGATDPVVRTAFQAYWTAELSSIPSVARKSRAELRTLHGQLKLLGELAPLAEAAFRTRVGAMTRAETEALVANESWLVQTTRAALLDRVKTERLVATAEGMQGQLRWAGASGPDESDHYRIRTTTRRPTDDAFAPGSANPGAVETNTNEFAVWVRGGAEPTTTSQMNCWEMVLFSGYRAGVIPRAWITRVHQRAASAGDAASSPEAYQEVLANGLGFASATTWTSGTAVPRGNVVFFDGLAHVAISTGNVTGGRQEVMSLWILPGRSGGTLNSVNQRTTIEALVANGIVAITEVKHAPNPW